MSDIIKILKESGALHEGHTRFVNGFHGNGWLEKDAVVRNPKYLDKIAKLQADLISDEFPGVSLLMGPVTGGAIIVSHVARHLGTEFGVILGKQEPILFHDMNIPKTEDGVVLVEDIISSGSDMSRFVSFLKQNDTNVVGISVWMNRKESEIENIRVTSLLNAPFELYEKGSCPLCAKEIAITYNDIRE